jgi:hypothetical protein
MRVKERERERERKRERERESVRKKRERDRIKKQGFQTLSSFTFVTLRALAVR